MTIREAIKKSAEENISLSEFVRNYLKVKLEKTKFNKVPYEEVKDEIHSVKPVTYDEIKHEYIIIKDEKIQE